MFSRGHFRQRHRFSNPGNLAGNLATKLVLEWFSRTGNPLRVNAAVEKLHDCRAYTLLQMVDET
jgi:hypothetical protein